MIPQEPTMTSSNKTSSSNTSHCSESLFLPCEEYSCSLQCSSENTTTTTPSAGVSRRKKKNNSVWNVETFSSPMTCGSSDSESCSTATAEEEWRSFSPSSLLLGKTSAYEKQKKTSMESSVEASSPVAVASSTGASSSVFHNNLDVKLSIGRHLGCLPLKNTALVKEEESVEQDDDNEINTSVYHYPRDDKENRSESSECTKYSSTTADIGKTFVADKYQTTATSREALSSRQITRCCEIM